MSSNERNGRLHEADPDDRLVIHSTHRVSMDVVELEGVLTRDEAADAIRACTQDHLRHVLLDLSRLTFMDCAGWGALVAAEATLRRRGGSLSLGHAVGEPHRLITLIRQLEDEQVPVDPRS